MSSSEHRDYKHEYSKFQSDESDKKRRAARNKARRHLERNGRVHKGDGKDIDHKDGNPLNNSSANIRVVDRSVNRSKH